MTNQTDPVVENTGDKILGPYPWQELPFDQGGNFDPLLISIVSFGRKLRSHGVGTGFIVSRDGNRAVAISAAHNFYEGVYRSQQAKARPHGSALPEFTPGFEEVSIDQENSAFTTKAQLVKTCVLSNTWRGIRRETSPCYA